MELHLNHQYWYKDDYQQLHKAENYTDLMIIAMNVLHRMPNPIIEVCGPISSGGQGSIEANMEVFKAAIKQLHDGGHIVFDQTPFEEPMQAIKRSQGEAGSSLILLEEFYLPIFESGMIAEFHFLPDWKSSHGATWERKQAERLGIPIIDL